MKLKAFLFFIFTLLIGFLFIQCPAQGTSGGGGGSGGNSSSSSSYTTSGVYDTAFNNSGSGTNNSIYATAIQSDGKILIGGVFTTYNSTNVPDYIMRLNSDGSVDTTFNIGGAGLDNYVWDIKLQEDGKILLGGMFSTYNGINVPDHIIQLNEDGSLDTTFNNGGIGTNNGNVPAIAIQPDGKILIGGDFTTYNGINVPWCIMRLEENGSPDLTFNNGGSGANNSIQAMTVQSDGKILIGGGVTTYNGVNTPDYFMRLNANGSIDTTFDNGGSGFDWYVNKIKVKKNGMILVGGEFLHYNGSDVNNYIIQLNDFGNVDSTFNNGGSGADNIISDMAIQSDGKLLIGGSFTNYNGVDVSDYIMRLNTDGSIDTTFNNGGTGANNSVYTLTLQSNGMLLIGGDFTTYNGVNVPAYIIRLK